jgi:hypothetical protein
MKSYSFWERERYTSRYRCSSDEGVACVERNNGAGTICRLSYYPKDSPSREISAEYSIKLGRLLHPVSKKDAETLLKAGKMVKNGRGLTGGIRTCIEDYLIKNLEKIAG